MKETLDKIVKKIKENSLAILIPTTMLTILSLGTYYGIKDMETRGGKVIGTGVEGIHKGGPQIQPWLAVWDIDNDGVPDSTSVMSVLFPYTLMAYNRESTQAEIEWYKAN